MDGTFGLCRDKRPLINFIMVYVYELVLIISF